MDTNIVKTIYYDGEYKSYYCNISTIIDKEKYYDMINNDDQNISKIWQICHIFKKKLYSDESLIDKWKLSKKINTFNLSFDEYKEYQNTIKHNTIKYHFLIFYKSNKLLSTHRNISNYLQCIAIKELPDKLFIIDSFFNYHHIIYIPFIFFKGQVYNGDVFIGDLSSIANMLNEISFFILDMKQFDESKTVYAQNLIKLLVPQFKININENIIIKLYRYLLTVNSKGAIKYLNNNRNHISFFIDATFDNINYHPLLHSVLNFFITNDYPTIYIKKIYYTLAELILCNPIKLSEDEQLAVLTYLKYADNYNNCNDRLKNLSNEYNIDIDDL